MKEEEKEKDENPKCEETKTRIIVLLSAREMERKNECRSNVFSRK